MIDRLLRLTVAAMAFAAPATLAAQDIACDPGDAEVRHLKFEGNAAFRGYVLANGIHTEQSSLARRWLRFLGKKKCLDRSELPNDVARIRKYYNQRGFLAATVTASVEPPDGRQVTVRFRIDEGPETIVDTLQVSGLDSVPERAEVLEKLPLAQGERLDRLAVAATVDSLGRRLRDRGYPAADVLIDLLQTDSARQSAVVKFAVVPGRRARIESIAIVVRPRPGAPNPDAQISNGTVRRLLGVREGETYSERRLESGLTRLYLSDAYSSTKVEIDSVDAIPPGDSLVKINVDLTETFMHTSTASGGWGTLDCFRAQGGYQHNNFLRDARRFDARLRLSKIGIGRPLSGASALCDSKIRRDPYSEKLNYYAGLTVSDRTASVWGFRPSFTVYSERRGEFFAYLRTTPVGGLLTATRESSNGRRSVNFSYQLEYGRTEAQPAIFCALFNLCLPEDRAPVLDYRRLAVAGASVRRSWTDDPQYPTRGAVANVELRHASSGIGSDGDLQFNRATGDVSLYAPLGRGIVGAARFRAGVVVGPSFTGVSRFIPPQERMFGGTAVRGFDQNDLGPRVYIASGYDTVRATGALGDITPSDTVFFRTKADARADRSVPTGGSAMFAANFELRVPSPVLADRLRLTFFTDAGEVWTPGAAQSEDRLRNLKVTPGFGMRLITLVGLIGFDLSYNPYPPRAGATFFDTPVSLGGQLYCVSPGNELAVTGLGVAGSPPVQASGSCVNSFRPRAERSFLRKLNLQFAIGYAF